MVPSAYHFLAAIQFGFFHSFVFDVAVGSDSKVNLVIYWLNLVAHGKMVVNYVKSLFFKLFKTVPRLDFEFLRLG